MPRARRVLLIATALAATAGGAAGCGEQGIDPNLSASNHAGASIFVEHCSGCHTLNVAGTEGSATNVRTREYKDGPNFNQRKETKNCILYAIRNGGFSSGPMPQNIVTGPEAQLVAEFISRYSGSDIKPSPGQGPAADTDCPPG